MIYFFRRIRQGLINRERVGKYLLYAVGEILLVVLGILIALQVNDWNEERKQQNQLRRYMSSFVADLEADLEMVDTVYLQAKMIVDRIDKLSSYTRDKSVDEIENIDLLCLSWTKSNRPFLWNRATLEELKNSGFISNIDNEELKRKISEYDALTHHLDEDFKNDKTHFDLASKAINEVVDANYPNINELNLVLLDPSNPIEAVDIFNSPEYQEGKKYNLQLLTNDINKIKTAVSTFITLKHHLTIRTDNELPRLMAEADALITLLKREYDL